MLIPRNRLLAVVALGLLPLAVVAGLFPPPFSPLALAVAGALGLVVVGDSAWGLWRGARGVGFTLPEIVRLSKSRPGPVSVVVVNGTRGAAARRLRVGLGLPEEITTAHETLALPLAAGVERTRFDWPCVAARRGRFRVERVYYEEASPLGLWAVRRAAAVACELRVYPDLRAERRQVAAVFLHRGGLGSHAQRQVGRGRDFEKLRDYVPGDSIQDISWKATARRQRPVSKVFQVERTQEVYVLVDASRLSARPASAMQAAEAGEGEPAADEAWRRKRTPPCPPGPRPWSATFPVP